VAPEPIPLFPLHTVLFPGAVLPLHVFEERYRLLVREGHDFGVVLIRQGWEVGPGRGEDTYGVGTLAHPERVDELPDGRFAMLVRGVRRFRLGALDHGRPYLQGEVEWLDDPAPQPRPRLLELMQRYLDAYGVELPRELATPGGLRAVWLVGALLQIEPWRRQRLLETGDADVAEQLLQEELAKIARLGRLGAARPPRASPN
jgi:Lon protease-like protein